MFDLPPRNNYDKIAGIMCFTVLFTCFCGFVSLFAGHEDCEGSPRFMVYANIVIQTTLLLPLPYVAWYEAGDFEWYWLSSRFEEHKVSDALMLYITIAYCMKDVPWVRDPMLLAHHVACIVGTGLMLFAPVRGVCLFLVCTSWLELGSLWTNLIFLWPTRRILLDLCFVMMSLSNVIVLVALVWFMFVAEWGITKFYIVPCTMTLTVFRQKAAFGYLRTFNEHGTLMPAAKAKQS
eukprot:TRINITY_DN10018_c0_g1_i1.p1 TRINITY_DN10018_c0_g1~~TRINITY_DN10018_c0_g1_i1.p1  ORF type:complete len:266 (+),score=69.04 TRINITY_DN10018_c0_g1_i1:94-798(+)